MSLKLTRISDYALRGMIHLAMKQDGGLSTLAEICKKNSIPASLMAKIVQQLVKSGLIHSIRGNKGGLKLGKPAEKITMKNVIEAVDGPIILNHCIKADVCDRDNICGAHHAWREMQDKFLEILESYTLTDLAKKEDKKGNII